MTASRATRKESLFIGMRLQFWSITHHHIEGRSELAGFAAFQRIEIDRHGVALFLVFDAAPDAVLLVSGMALDIALSRPLLVAFHLHGVVNMRRTSRIGDRLDRAE